ncbi:hypothetical protein EDB19DRAFT_1766243 [Suillus lakei]|nr:hypothetical protein EDB19DRAFT_1766243 [Suillus lakei]
MPTKNTMDFLEVPAINIAEWSGASASLALGLTVPQAIIVNLTSTIIITVALVISGYGGGQWHVPFVSDTLPFSISS